MQHNLSLDGHTRKRIYLFRHGDVSYMTNGQFVKEPNHVDLTPKGKKQALAIDENTKNVRFDRIVTSGLPRTIQTATPIAERRGISIESYSALIEYQWSPRSIAGTSIEKFGFLFEDPEFQASIGGLETMDDFSARVVQQLTNLLREDWHQIALVLHGAVNAAIMCWVNDLEINQASKFDQDHGALNVLDFDIDTNEAVVRKCIRRFNIPPFFDDLNPQWMSSWESTAAKFLNDSHPIERQADLP